MEFRGLTALNYQEKAFEKINEGHHVIVATATGNGKTLIADYGINESLKKNLGSIYTSPIKSLSEDKYNQFEEIYGQDTVGIVTGDRVINDTAPVTVMTTEILRNKIYQSLDGFSNVERMILDEIHYLGNKSRGTVWEESIIFKPKGVKIIGLSATIPNVKEICDWMEDIYNEKVDCIIEPKRIIKQEHYYFDKNYGPCTRKEIVKKYLLNEQKKNSYTDHLDIMEYAKKNNQLNVLAFCDSRKKCESFANELINEINFNITDSEKSEIDSVLRYYEKIYPHLLKSSSWENLNEVLIKGVGYFHAGLLPTIKPVILELARRSLLKVMYSTSACSMGLNYSMKTVAILFDQIFDGNEFRSLLPSEYLQMAGRAGRQGIDNIGYVYTLVNEKYDDINSLIDLDKIKSEKIESQFNLSYNSTLNLTNIYNDQQINFFFNKCLNNFKYNKSIERTKQDLQVLEENFSNSTNPYKQCETFGSKSCSITENIQKQELKQKIRQAQQTTSKKERKNIQIEIEKINNELRSFKQCTCRKKECQEKYENYINLYKKIKDLKAFISSSKENSPEKQYKSRYNNMLMTLNDLGYIDKDKNLLPRGNACSKIYVNELLVTEIIYNDLINHIDVHSLNGLIACVAGDSGKFEALGTVPSFDFSEVDAIIKHLGKIERKYGIISQVELSKKVFPIIYNWSKGENFQDLTQKYCIAEGDFVALCKRTVELLKQIKNASEDDIRTVEKIDNCISKAFRDIVAECN